jgi:hypothetical protein
MGNYINNIPVLNGELTVVTSDHATATMRHASQLAFDAKGLGLNVLIINCGMSDKRFRGHIHEKFGEQVYHANRMVIHTSVCGDLVGERDALDNIIYQANISTIILCGWEFASSTPRRKERLMFYLRELMANNNVSVTVYCHTAIAPVAGKIDRGGIGKLSLMAFQICEVDSSKQLEPILQRPKAIVATGQDIDEATESVRLLLNKVNALAGDGQKILLPHEAPKKQSPPPPIYRGSLDDEEVGGVPVFA